MSCKKIIVVCGPTASGKTDAAVAIAKKLDSEIVSADSMQIYKEMNIGTAKPDVNERCGVKHHMFDVASVCDDYNVTKFVEHAGAVIDELHFKNIIPVLVGGTGLYIDSLINNVEFSVNSVDNKYREELFELYKIKGADYLHSLLERADPVSAQKIHKNNIKRVIRALEIINTTGLTLEQVNANSVRERKYQPIFIGLNFRDRALLYDRIDKRVDIMIENGLIDEAKNLYSLELSSTSCAAIGYKELFKYFDGECSCAEAIEEIKKNSRNYAKRQLTWFKRNKEIIWFYRDDYDDAIKLQNEICDYVLNLLEV